MGYIREWIIQNHRIVASIDLNADTFQPRNGTQTSVLILQKKTQEQRDAEEKSGKMADYNIFMAMVEKVGHDKRGNPLFKRDKEGNEILVPDTNSVLVLGETGEGQRTVSHEQKAVSYTHLSSGSTSVNARMPTSIMESSGSKVVQFWSHMPGADTSRVSRLS